TTSYSPPSHCARVARSDWRSFAAEIHRNKVMVRKAPKRPRSGASLEAGRDTTLEEGRVRARSSKGKEPIRLVATEKWVVDLKVKVDRFKAELREAEQRQEELKKEANDNHIQLMEDVLHGERAPKVDP
ncbi:hypothetical protein BHM03_00056950, partial [Ensete ventricosum]